MVEKSTVPLSRMWDMGLDINLNKNSGRPGKPYSQVEWVWICVNLIIDVCNSIQMVLSNSNDEVVESGDAYNFLFRNQDMPFTQLLSETVGFYSLYRQVYWIFADKQLLSPKSIIVAGPEQCRPVIKQGELVGYELHTNSGKKVPLFLEDVWAITNFNPDSNFLGTGPLTAGRMAINSSYQATQYNEATLANGARIGTMLTTPPGVKLDADEKRALVAQFDGTHKGARQAGKTFLATGGLEVKTLGQTMAELQMIDLRKYDAGTICALFRVPPEIVSLNPEAQYTHGPATQRFVMYTIAPMLSFIAQHLTLGILHTFRFKSTKGVSIENAKSFGGSRLPISRKYSYRQAKIKAIQSNQGLFGWFDVESHPAIQEMERDKIEKVMSNVKYGVPLNQIIEVYDLPFDTSQIPWGNEHFVSPALMPARWIIEAGPDGLTEPSLPEGGDEPEDKDDKSISVPSDTDILEKADDAAKLRIWKNWVISWAGIEREYKEAMRKFFVRQQRQLLGELKKALGQNKTINKDQTDEVIARVVLDLKKENGKIKIINQTFFEKSSELGIRQVASEVGLSTETIKDFVETTKRNTAIRQALAKQAQNIKGINKTTQNTIARTLRQGLEKGESINGLTERIKNTLGTNRKRALSIARTQTAGAIGSGRHAGMKHAGVKLKIWLTSGDSNVRPSHKDAGKRYAKGIALDKPFVIDGDFLMHPGDPNASPGSIINCRCVELMGKSKGKSIDYSRVEFYSYNNLKSEVDNG